MQNNKNNTCLSLTRRPRKRGPLLGGISALVQMLWWERRKRTHIRTRKGKKERDHQLYFASFFSQKWLRRKNWKSSKKICTRGEKGEKSEINLSGSRYYIFLIFLRLEEEEEEEEEEEKEGKEEKKRGGGNPSHRSRQRNPSKKVCKKEEKGEKKKVKFNLATHTHNRQWGEGEQPPFPLSFFLSDHWLQVQGKKEKEVFFLRKKRGGETKRRRFFSFFFPSSCNSFCASHRRSFGGGLVPPPDW